MRVNSETGALINDTVLWEKEKEGYELYKNTNARATWWGTEAGDAIGEGSRDSKYVIVYEVNNPMIEKLI